MRLAVGLLLALLINLGLFTLMHLMTSSERVERNAMEDIQLLDFVRVKKESVTETKERQLPEKPKPPEKTPPPPKIMPPTQQVKAPTPKMNVPNIKVPLNIAGGPYLGEFSAAPTAPVSPDAIDEYAQVAPLVRIPPRYPRSASRRGIEGVVKVAFTITKEGRVANPRVLQANPVGVFDKAALRAIKKWKFNPKMVDGQAVEQTAAQEITFRLSK
jgi:periplasmic protein TonB